MDQENLLQLHLKCPTFSKIYLILNFILMKLPKFYPNEIILCIWWNNRPKQKRSPEISQNLSVQLG